MSPPRPLLASPWFLGVLALALLAWWLNLAVLRAGVPHPLDDTWEDGIVARLLLQGEGFRSHMIYPPLWELRDPRTLTIPMLIHGPLLPLLLAAPLRFAGPGVIDRMAWIAALFALLALFPLFRLAARHFGEPVAAGASGLFALSPLTTAAIDHYASVVLGAFLLVWALDLLARDAPRSVAAGIVAGLCSLTRPEMMLAAPILAWIASVSARATPASWTLGASGAQEQGHRPGTARGLRLTAPWIFLLAFAACCSWWWWERWRAVGSPFFNLSSYLIVCFSPAFPGDGLVRDFSATPSRFLALLAEALPTLWIKWANFFPRAVKRALSTPGEALGWLTPLGAFSARHHPIFGRYVGPLALLALVPVVAITVIAPVRLYPVPFLPVYCIAAALGARAVMGRLPRWAHRPRAWLGLLAMLAFPSAILEVREQERDARHQERWLARDRAGLREARRTPENARRLMFSDTPDFVAWTTERPTVWLTREEFERLFAKPAAELPPGIPRRPDPADTWFHRGDPRDPVDQAGARIEP